MIATAEEYLQQIWRLYDGNVPRTAIILPSDESIYEIDLDTRTIKSPYLAGITKEQAAETFYFVVDRFHGEVDLANTACIVYYKNSKGETGFYPVPFYDITTFSSLITQSYIEVHLSDVTYVKNVFYIKNNDDYVLCSDDKFDKNKTYYEFNDTSTNKKYEKVDITVKDYQIGKYWIMDNEGKNPTMQFMIDNREDFHEDEHYYVQMEKRYINAHVEYSNYKSNTYYVLNNQNELVLDRGPYNKEIQYYSILDKPKLLFPWTIGGVATNEVGELQFAVRFYQIQTYTNEDNQTEYKLVYNLSTKPVVTRVLEGLEVEIDDEQFQTDLTNTPDYWQFVASDATVLEDIYYRLNLATNKEIYWIEA